MSETDKHGLLSAKQAASRLGVSDRNLRAKERAGDIPSIRLGKRVLFSEKALSDFAASLEKRRQRQSRVVPMDSEASAISAIISAAQTLKHAHTQREHRRVLLLRHGKADDDGNLMRQVQELTLDVAERDAHIAELNDRIATMEAERSSLADSERVLTVPAEALSDEESAAARSRFASSDGKIQPQPRRPRAAKQAAKG